MRILHAPLDIAGQCALSAQGLRAIGHTARSYAQGHPFAFDGVDYRPRFNGRLARQFESMGWLARFAFRYDVFHFHAGASFFSGRAGHFDARLLRRMGKVVAVEFWGDEARLPSTEAANPFYVNPYHADERENRERLARWAGITGGHAIVADHGLDASLTQFFPHLHYVGQRVDTERLQPVYPDPDTRVPVVAHAPSHTLAKGTRYVREAVEALRAKGMRFEYVELHGMAHDEVMRACARADLVIDQLCIGAHGVLSVEAMALGKPVFCRISDELRPTYPADLPLILADPHTVAGRLEEWLCRPEDRRTVGMASRRYAERQHDCRAVAERLVRAYAEMA